MCANAESRRSGRRPSQMRIPAKEILDYVLDKGSGHVNVFVDRYGNRHSGAIFQHWSPAVIRAMGRPLVVGGDNGR
jgi:hypothetical protein